jgi:hypothetical protein
MIGPRRAALAAFLTMVSPGSSWGSGAAAQAIENTKNTCHAAALAQERRWAIPRGLLAAIALAETGRWDRAKRASFAWPWTVTARAQGRHFATKAAAIHHVRALRTEGVSNIDVGCMQINLGYHGQAFSDLDQAFDPATNVAYAARYLRQQRQAAGSWIEAAGRYHSATPEYGHAYRRRITELWDGLGRAVEPVPVPTTRTARPDRTIDHARMTRLAEAFRDRRPIRPEAASPWPAWRNGDADAFARLAAMRRARLGAERKRRLHGPAS